MKRVGTALMAVAAMLAAVALGASAQATPNSKPTAHAHANEIVIDGEPFHHDRVVFASKDCSAVWFTDTINNGKASSTRLTMHGTLNQRDIQLQLSWPSNKPGTIEIAPGDDDSWNLSHWAILVLADGPTYGSGLQAKLQSLTITVSQYDAPGGLIQGTFAGALQKGLRVEGSFSIKRGADIKSY